MPNQNLIEKLSKRNDDGASKEFFKVFGDVVESYLAYRKWVQMMIKKNGHYHDRTDVIPKLVDSLELIESIIYSGQERPIIEFEDEFGPEIDGYHRLVIMQKLGRVCK